MLFIFTVEVFAGSNAAFSLLHAGKLMYEITFKIIRNNTT